MERGKAKTEAAGNKKRAPAATVKSEPLNVPVQSILDESLQCFQCLITFSDHKAKERHMRKSHRDLYNIQLQQNNTLFTCYTCDKCFSSSTDLTLHQITHTKTEKLFLCSYCRKSFHILSELTKHRRNECIERRWTCSTCGALFPNPAQLRNHRFLAHPQIPAPGDDINIPAGGDDVDLYQCYKCDRAFKSEENLLQHVEEFADDPNCGTKDQGLKRQHEPEEEAAEFFDSKKIKQEEETEGYDGYGDFPTDACNSGELQSELNIPCPEVNCDLAFPSVEDLRDHKKEMHDPLPPRKTQGRPEESAENPARRVNKARRTGHVCPTCGMSFVRDIALKLHQKLHTGDENKGEKR